MRAYALVSSTLLLAFCDKPRGAVTEDASALRPDSSALAGSLRRLVPLGITIDSAERLLVLAEFRCRQTGFGAPALSCRRPLGTDESGASLEWEARVWERGMDGVAHRVESLVRPPEPELRSRGR